MPPTKQVNQEPQLPVLNALSDAPVVKEKVIEKPKKEIKEFDEDSDKIKQMINKTEFKIKAQQREPEMYVFKLLIPEGVKPKTYESVVNEMPVFDSESQSVRTIRLVRGASSIYMDEQEGYTPQYLQRNKLDIVFNNGFLRVPRTNKTLLKFLLTSDDYDKKEERLKGKKPKYTLVNSADVENKELIKEETKLRAINTAMNAEVEDMLIHAEFLGIQMINQYGEQKSLAKIRVDYANKAAEKPEYFMSTSGSPAAKAQYFVKKGLDAGVLDVASKKGYLTWKDSDKVITEIPFGKSAVETIANFILSATDDANDFYKRLKEVL
jgi:microcompartment protein CcmK/EutM